MLARTPESDIVELTCSAAWFINRGALGGNPDTEIYAEEWSRAAAFRERYVTPIHAAHDTWPCSRHLVETAPNLHAHRFTPAARTIGRNAALVAAWVRVRADVRERAEAEWRRIIGAQTTAVIGIHLRGTDKYQTPKVYAATRYIRPHLLDLGGHAIRTRADIAVVQPHLL